MKYVLKCTKCRKTKVADNSFTNKEVIKAFNKAHEKCGGIRILPQTRG